MVSDSCVLIFSYFVFGIMTSYTALSNAGEPTCNMEQVQNCRSAALSPTAHNLEQWGKCAADTYVSYTHVCTVDNYRENVVYCCCVHSQKAMCCGYHRVFDQFRCSEPHDIIADVNWSPNPPGGYQTGNRSNSEEALPTHILVIIIAAAVTLAVLSIIVASVIVTRRRKKTGSSSSSTCNCFLSEEEGEEKPTPVTPVPEQLQEERRPLNEPMSSEPSSLETDCETKHIPDDAFTRSATPTAPPISSDDIYDCDNCRNRTASAQRRRASAEQYASVPPLCSHHHHHPPTQGEPGNIRVPPYTAQMSTDSDVFFAPGTGASSPDSGSGVNYNRSASMPAHMVPHVPQCPSCSSAPPGAPPSYEDSLYHPVLPTQ